MANERDAATLDGENDLRQFLKVVQPDWSMPRRHQSSDINRVVKKLTAIGVKDSADLMSKVTTNKINEDLSSAGYSRLSKDSIDRIRTHGTFFRALENLTEAHYRQVGVFAPVAQLLSKTNLKKTADRRQTERRFVDEKIGDMPLPGADTAEGDGFGSPCSSHARRSLTGPSRGSTSMSFCELPSPSKALHPSFSDGNFFASGADPTHGPPRLRGYRGHIRGTAAGAVKPRPATTGTSSLPSLRTPETGSSPQQLPTRISPGLSFNLTADFGNTLGISGASKGPLYGSIASLAGSAQFSRGAVLVERAKGAKVAGQSGETMERPGSPTSRTLPRGAWPVDFEAEIQEIAFVAATLPQNGGTGGLPAPIEEAFEKLSRLGEEELSLLAVGTTFDAQEGSDTQVFRIATHYAKLGLDPLRVARTLKNPALIVLQVRRQLDLAVVMKVQKAGEDMAFKSRPSCWAGFARSPPTPPKGAKSGGGEGGLGSPGSSGSLAQQLAESPAPAWKERGRRSVDRYAQQMLKEQEEIEAKNTLCRIMEAEGPASPFRKFVAENIRSRLTEEKDPEGEKMEVNQLCNNIRRQLSTMGDAKKELNTLRRTVESLNADHADKAQALGAFGKMRF